MCRNRSMRKKNLQGAFVTFCDAGIVWWQEQIKHMIQNLSNIDKDHWE